MVPELSIVYVPDEAGGYTAYIPEIPGAVSEGETVEEARRMVFEALGSLGAYRREQDAEQRPTNAFSESLKIERIPALV